MVSQHCREYVLITLQTIRNSHNPLFYLYLFIILFFIPPLKDTNFPSVV